MYEFTFMVLPPLLEKRKKVGVSKYCDSLFLAMADETLLKRIHSLRKELALMAVYLFLHETGGKKLKVAEFKGFQVKTGPRVLMAYKDSLGQKVGQCNTTC